MKRERLSTWFMRVGLALAVIGLALEVVGYLTTANAPTGVALFQIPVGGLAIVIAGVGLGLAIAGYAIAGRL